MAQVAAHILLAPGRLGLRTFAVQDDTGAIQARFTAAPPPGLKPGSGVVLLATLRRQNGKPYLSVGKNALTSTGASHAVHYVDFENEQPASRTAAATVTGSVVKTGGATLRLALADEHELRVSAAKDMKLPVLTKGDRVAAQGTVVWDSQGTPELLLEKDGLTTLPPEPEPDAPVQDSRAPQVIAAPEDAAERQAAPWPLVLLLLPPAGILAWKWRQHRASVASSVTIATEPASTPPPRPPLQLSSPSLSPSIAAMDWRPPRS